MNNDWISRSALKKDINSLYEYDTYNKEFDAGVQSILNLIDNALAVKEATVAEKTLDNQWIPIRFRRADDDEYKEFIERYGDIPREECEVYDCQMPYDGQEVLITTSWGSVCEDIFHADPFHNPECYGFEDHDDPDDVIAWMPKPEAYKKGGDGE